MITIEPAKVIEFDEFLNYEWVKNSNDGDIFNGYGYNPNDEKDYEIVSNDVNHVWTLLKDGEQSWHFYSGFYPRGEDVYCYILTKNIAELNIKVNPAPID